MTRDTDGEISEFERGDVVWGIDPVNRDPAGDDATSADDAALVPRPWLVISTDVVPFHPDQYLCLTLPTRTWHADSIPLTSEDWREGGAPADSSIMPWSISAIKHEFLDTTGELVAPLEHVSEDAPEDGYQGHLTAEITAEATRTVIEYLQAPLDS